MTAPSQPNAVPRGVDLVLREFVNALSKAGMYPVGHRFITESSAALVERLRLAMAERDDLTIGILPRGLLIDGVAVDPISAVLREFAARMHRKSIGTIQLRAGVAPDELATMLAALSASNADETIGRDGLRLEHVRVEPISYEVLTFADSDTDRPMDQDFWESLVESAFGRALNGDAAPSSAQLAEAISERAVAEADGAYRVYDALASFASALAARDEQYGSAATQRFNEVLTALSRSTTSRVLAAAPTAASRRRFLRESVELIPPALLLQLLESVAEADGQPISPELRLLLGKVAGEAGSDNAAARDTFTASVTGLVQYWDGLGDGLNEMHYPQFAVAPDDVVGIGLATGSCAGLVIVAARRMIDAGRLAALLGMFDAPASDRTAATAIADAVLDPSLMQRLLSDPDVDFALVERVAMRNGAGAVNQLLDALGAASDRTARRRLLDLLVRIGPAAESMLQARMAGAPWYLVRNILAVLAQFPAIQDFSPIFAALSDAEPRVRQEALKVLVRQAAVRDRASVLGIESGEEALVRIALNALGTECPPRVLPSVLPLLRAPDAEIQQLAVRTLFDARQSAVVKPLLDLVWARRGIFRRRRLLARSPVMVDALEILARRWRDNRDVAGVLDLARQSADPAIRTAGGA